MKDIKKTIDKKIENLKNKKIVKKQELQEKGITLIALVVTIIILLILAGVTLNIALSDNGLFGKAKKAVEKYKIGEIEERLGLAIQEYEATLRTETLYSILSKVNGLESIEPDDPQAGPPYTVVVEGYEFEIDKDLNIEYKGKDDGIVPEIKIERVDEESTIKLKITANTKDSEGLKEIVIINNEIEIGTIELEGGKQTEKSYEVNKNGKYKAKIKAKNGKQAISNEIEITELSTVSGTIKEGTVVDGKVTLTVTAETQEEKIAKIEIYDEKDTKITEKEYEENKNKIEEEFLITAPFYEEKNYYAKIIDNTKAEGETDKVKIKNEKYINTEKDIQNFSKAVNEDNVTFENKEIKQVEDIKLTTNHEAIGTQEHPFKGTYNGQNKTISGIKISKNNEICQGFFGYIENATIKDLKLGEGTISAGNKIGGLVGYAKNSSIQKIENNGTSVKSNTSYEEKGKIVGDIVNKEPSIGNWNVQACSTGGICGKAEDTSINDCINSKAIGNASGVFTRRNCRICNRKYKNS